MDTNVISDYLSASLPLAGLNFLDQVIDDGPLISIITQIELFCWNTDEATTALVQNFMADSEILGIDDHVVNHCVAIRKGKKIKTPDAIIAATAIAKGLTLITNNEKDFKNVHGLNIFNPHKM